MLSVEQIHEWRAQDVLDRDGERIGKLDDVFYDARSGEAVFVSVKSGLLGRRSKLVSLAGATVGRGHVRVAHAAGDVERVEAEEEGGQLDPAAVHAAANAYGIEIGQDARFESATLITERHEHAAEVVRRADELEQEARRRAEEVKAARQRAVDAARDADEAERELAEAQQAAAEARQQADRVASGAAPPPQAH
jgi:hypothetical protein